MHGGVNFDDVYTLVPQSLQCMAIAVQHEAKAHTPVTAIHVVVCSDVLEKKAALCLPRRGKLNWIPRQPRVSPKPEQDVIPTSSQGGISMAR